MRGFISKSLLAAAAALVTASSAQAYIEIGINDTSGGAVFCSTQNAGTIAACVLAGFDVSNVNSVSFTGQVGGFEVLGFTSAFSNSPGTATIGLMNNTTNAVTNKTSLGDLFINVIGYGYDAPVGPRRFSGTTTFGSNVYDANDKVVTVLTFDPSNGGGDNFAAGTTSFSETLGLPAPNGDAQSVTKNFSAVGVGASPLYSLRHKQTYDIAVGSIVDTFANSNVRRVPEPLSLALVGVALVGAAVASRRKAA